MIFDLIISIICLFLFIILNLGLLKWLKINYNVIFKPFYYIYYSIKFRRAIRIAKNRILYLRRNLGDIKEIINIKRQIRRYKGGKIV